MNCTAMSEDMIKYYRDRAKEYEQVYEWRDPNRQEEQLQMEKEMKEQLARTELIDIGCGTGYWTSRVSETAKSIVGIDINQSVLDIALNKTYKCPTEFKIMDAYNIQYSEKTFTGALASFWLSHIRLENIDQWIIQMHKKLKPNARVFISDNSYIEGISGELIRKADDKNTYRLRTLNDGSKHLIIKNYFTKEELLTIFSKHSKINIENVFQGKCFWWIKYSINY